MRWSPGEYHEIAAQLAAICEGNYREAMQLLQHAGEDWISLLRDWLNFTLTRKLGEQVKWVSAVNYSVAKNKNNCCFILTTCSSKA